MPASNQATVLVVEDDPINRDILEMGLAEQFLLLFAANGAEALELCHRHHPDVVLLDIELPDFSGYEVCAHLKREQATRDIPIIFSTGRDSSDDEIKGLEAGAADYITKPYHMALVILRLRNQVQLKRKTELLERLAHLDGLTQIPNRRRFDDTFDLEWRRAIRKGYQISLCLIDIDYFKQFNDEYGHSGGDKCLQDVAAELSRQARRAGDFVARYGGEEFAMILPDTHAMAAASIAERICHGIRNLNIPHVKSGCSEMVTVSIGTATLVPTQDMDKKEFINAADEQLYLAKGKGRNTFMSTQLSVSTALSRP